MPDIWREIATRKFRQRKERIPPEWLLPAPLAAAASERNNVLSIPHDSGLLSVDELRLTEAHDATALLAGLSSGLLSSVDVTRAFCKRSAIAQQCCNCLTEIFYDDALARAAWLDEQFARTGRPVGPLHGLPISLKDTFKVKGYDASIGYAALCFQPATTNSALVDLLLELGAVLYCKTNIPQALSALDSNNNVFGRTLNPRNKKLTAGGSSGGEGALIAMRGSILGIGTDIGGSIRIPAACNGLYGVKPSHGRVPYAGQESGSAPGSNKLGIEATAGPIATTMRDCETFLRIISNSEAATFDPDVISQPWSNLTPLACVQDRNMLRPLRVGVMRSDGHVTPLPPIQRLMDEVIRTLSTNCNHIELVELDLSAMGPPSLKALNGVMSIDGANSYLDLLEKTGEPLSPWHSSRIRRRPQKSLDDVRKIQASRTELQTEFLKVWKPSGGYWLPAGQNKRETDHGLDVIICPTAPHPTPPIDRWNTSNYTSMFNVMDSPSGVLPIRFLSKDDLRGELAEGKALNGWDQVNRELWTKVDRQAYIDGPTSIQVVAPRLMERQLVEAMAILDQALRPLGADSRPASKL